MASPIRSPQDLASNESPGSSRPLHTDWGSVSLILGLSSPYQISTWFILPFFNHFGFPQGKGSGLQFLFVSLLMIIVVSIRALYLQNHGFSINQPNEFAFVSIIHLSLH